jgi:hypothetical protein
MDIQEAAEDGRNRGLVAEPIGFQGSQSPPATSAAMLAAAAPAAGSARPSHPKLLGHVVGASKVPGMPWLLQ